MILHSRGSRLGAGAGLFLVGLVSAGVAWATLLTAQPVVTAKGASSSLRRHPVGRTLRTLSPGRGIPTGSTCM